MSGTQQQGPPEPADDAPRPLTAEEAALVAAAERAGVGEIARQLIGGHAPPPANPVFAPPIPEPPVQAIADADPFENIEQDHNGGADDDGDDDDDDGDDDGDDDENDGVVIDDGGVNWALPALHDAQDATVAAPNHEFVGELRRSRIVRGPLQGMEADNGHNFTRFTVTTPGIPNYRYVAPGLYQENAGENMPPPIPPPPAPPEPPRRARHAYRLAPAADIGAFGAVEAVEAVEAAPTAPDAPDAPDAAEEGAHAPDGKVERMPQGWDHRLRWPPVYMVYARDRCSIDDRMTGTSAWSPPFSRNQSHKQRSEESKAGCEQTLRGIARAERQYVIEPAPWSVVEKYLMDHDTASDKRPVWYREKWFVGNKFCQSTFPLVAKDDPTMISYFADAEKGARGIRTKIKPGRFLAKAFGSGLTEREIAAFAEWFISGVRQTRWSNQELNPMRFANTADEMAMVYANGPRSCMSPAVIAETRGGRERGATLDPVRAYAAGDLALAYLADAKDTRVWARCLVWPDRKVMGRIYPNTRSYREDGFNSEQDSIDCAKELEARLRKVGYSPLANSRTGFGGARLTLIPANDRRSAWAIPFLDNEYGIVLKKEDANGNPDESGTWVARMSKERGKISCNAANGRLEFRLPDDPAGVCAKCGTPILMDNDLVNVRVVPVSGKKPGQTWCRMCVSLGAFHCGGTGNTYSLADVPSSVTATGDRIANFFLEREREYYKSDVTGRWHYVGHNRPCALFDGRIISSSEIMTHGFESIINGKVYLNDQRHPVWPNVHVDATDAEIAEWRHELKGGG